MVIRRAVDVSPLVFLIPITGGLKPSGRLGNRAAFTLLEVMLAISIGVVLLWGLYVAMDIQLSQAQIGRDLVEQGTLARSLLNKISADINNHLGPVDPRTLATTTSSSTTAANTTDTSGTTTNSTNATPAPATDTAVNFNIGVHGGSDWLVLTVGRVPRELAMFQSDPSKGGQLVSDLRRITYWMVEEGGLAWHETTEVTASDIPTVPGDIPNPLIISREVTKVGFEYFDGSSWQSSWDGTSVGEDGTTPIGPPSAIAITLSISRGQANTDGQMATATYRHVVAIPSANSLLPPGDLP